jgi:hypothetical protein
MIMMKPWWWKSSVFRFSITNHTSIIWNKKKKVKILVVFLTMIGMSFLFWHVYLLARPCDMDMTTREGRVCGEKRERVSHRGFGSIFVVDLGARHGIACHYYSWDSSIFSSSLALEMDHDDSFIFSWILWNLGCKSTIDLSSFQSLKRSHLKATKEGGFHGHTSLLTTLNNYHYDS